MNLGFALARGDTVIFLDADDVLWPDTGRRVVEAMASHVDVVRVQFPLDVIDKEGRRTGATMPATPTRLFSGDATARLLSCPDDIVWQPTSGNAFRKRSLQHILPMPTAPFRLCADYYLSNLVPLHGRVAVLDSSGGGYRVHGANGHFSNAATADRLRANLMRTYETHRCLIAEARRVGLVGLPTDPGAVHSVTFAGNRLLSYRLDRDRHPIAGDSRSRLLAFGVGSAMRRVDAPPLRRAAFAAWFLALTLAPQRMLPAVARPFVTIEPLGSNGQRVSTPERVGTGPQNVRRARRRR
jgi:hypothetical protein